MEKSKVLPSVILSVALIVSSIILYAGMTRLGDKVIDAGIYSRQIDLTRNNLPLRIVLDDDSEVNVHTGQDAHK